MKGQDQHYSAPQAQVQYVATTPGVPPTYYQAANDVERASLLQNEYQGERFKVESKWRDWPFLIAFIVHLAGIGAIIGFGANIKVDCNTPGQYQGWLIPCALADSDLSDVLPYAYMSSALAGTAIVFSFFYLQLLRAFPTAVIYAGIVLSLLSAIGFAVYLGFLGVIGGAVVFGIWAAFLAFYFFMIRSRIPFASEMIYTSSSVLSLYPGSMVISFLSIFVKIGFFALWSYTVMLSQRLQSTPSIIASVFLVFSFYWTFEVIKNVVHVSVSGVVATWYFMSQNMPAHPALGAFGRAMTTSLGSIAFGSLIVAVIKTLRSILRAVINRNSRNWVVVILSWIALCFLGCLDRLAQYFNHYAFCQVAIYGKTYIQAAKATWRLFKTSGLEAIVNDNLIDGVLWLGVLFGALVTGLAGYCYAFFIFRGVHVWAGFGLGFTIGFVLLVLAMQCLDSAVATIFVCFAEDKETLRNTKPQLYQHLMEAYYNINS